jgi:hypothetical protein
MPLQEPCYLPQEEITQKEHVMSGLRRALLRKLMWIEYLHVLKELFNPGRA